MIDGASRVAGTVYACLGYYPETNVGNLLNQPEAQEIALQKGDDLSVDFREVGIPAQLAIVSAHKSPPRYILPKEAAETAKTLSTKILESNTGAKGLSIQDLLEEYFVENLKAEDDDGKQLFIPGDVVEQPDEKKGGRQAHELGFQRLELCRRHFIEFLEKKWGEAGQLDMLFKKFKLDNHAPGRTKKEILQGVAGTYADHDYLTNTMVRPRYFIWLFTIATQSFNLLPDSDTQPAHTEIQDHVRNGGRGTSYGRMWVLKQGHCTTYLQTCEELFDEVEADVPKADVPDANAIPEEDYAKMEVSS